MAILVYEILQLTTHCNQNSIFTKHTRPASKRQGGICCQEYRLFVVNLQRIYQISKFCTGRSWLIVTYRDIAITWSQRNRAWLSSQCSCSQLTRTFRFTSHIRRCSLRFRRCCSNITLHRCRTKSYPIRFMLNSEVYICILSNRKFWWYSVSINLLTLAGSSVQTEEIAIHLSRTIQSPARTLDIVNIWAVELNWIWDSNNMCRICLRSERIPITKRNLNITTILRPYFSQN